MACPPWAFFPSKVLRPRYDRSRTWADGHLLGRWGHPKRAQSVCVASCSRRRATPVSMRRFGEHRSVPSASPSSRRSSRRGRVQRHGPGSRRTRRCNRRQTALPTVLPRPERSRKTSVSRDCSRNLGRCPPPRGWTFAPKPRLVRGERASLSRCRMTSRSVSLCHLRPSNATVARFARRSHGRLARAGVAESFSERKLCCILSFHRVRVPMNRRRPRLPVRDEGAVSRPSWGS